MRSSFNSNMRQLSLPITYPSFIIHHNTKQCSLAMVNHMTKVRGIVDRFTLPRECTQVL